MALKAALLSLGCKVNSYETERIREDMEGCGFEIVDFNEKADVYIINTCSVTNIADRKSRQMLNRARALNPEALVVATGCYVQSAKDNETLSGLADIIVGNNHKGSIKELVTAALKEKQNSKMLDEIALEKEVEDLSINDYPERSRAFVRIEDGCNQFCTYCIIPYARGRVRSRGEEEILSEIRNLAEKGFKEIVLTGIHISSYGYENYEKIMKEKQASEEGLTVSEFDGTPLLKLVKRIDEIEGIERIRLGSLEPRIITKEFALGLKDVTSFCPHFHLSLQSGCNTVLKRMNRHYSAEEFLEKCAILREVFDRPAITTDVIVGFPQETEEEFNESVLMVQKAAFSKMHIFKYSRRKGTVADRMPGQLTEKVKHERSIVLQDIDKKMHNEYAGSFIGQKVKVLIEEDDGAVLSGLTERYLRVCINKAGLDLNVDNIGINSIVEVKISAIDKDGNLTC